MRFTLWISQEDQKAFARYTRRKVAKMNLVLIILAIFLLVSVILGRAENEPWRATFPRLISTFLVWAVILGVIFVLFKLIKGPPKSIPIKTLGGVGEHAFVFADGKVTEESIEGKIESEFNQVRTVAETPKHYFIIMNPGLGLIFPKNEIERLPEKDTFLELLKSL